MLYSNEHYSTYDIHSIHPQTTNNSFVRTSVQHAPTDITTLFPLSTTLSLEQCTSSCHTFPLRRAVGSIYVSTRYTIIGGNLCIRVLPVSPFSPCDAPGISRCYPHPEREPCTIYGIACKCFPGYGAGGGAFRRVERLLSDVVCSGACWPIFVLLVKF